MVLPGIQTFIGTDNKARSKDPQCTLLRIVQRPKASVFKGNDPSAGSPTETLLQLLLPLNGKVWIGSVMSPVKRETRHLKSSPDHPIGRSDGRCVQRAGT